MTIIGDPREAGETGPAGDQRNAGEEGPAGDPRPAGDAQPAPKATKKAAPKSK